MINIWEMGIMRIRNLNQTPDSDWPQCDSTCMGNDFTDDSVPMCQVFLNPILKETQRSSFYRLNKQKQDSQHNAANLVPESLGSCATNFGDDIIQNLNFPIIIPNLVHESSPGTPM